MQKRIYQLVGESEPELIATRRDFHRHAEPGWCEFRTASIIARRLTELGWSVSAGRAVVDADARMGVPSTETLTKAWQRAHEQGGDPAFLSEVADGFTGIVGALHAGPGPTIALRFDIDALEIAESNEDSHRPAREGFASVNHGVCHACGHDAHAAAGLGVARVLREMHEALQGTVKLIFQPAEEGVRGAKSMVVAGVLDDVDVLLGHHVNNGWRVGEIEAGMGGYAATRKIDAFITGRPAHAGSCPHEGNNALLAAATAVLNLHAIARHGSGPTRINVGRLSAGEARNVIPSQAHLALEVRGSTAQICRYVADRAHEILETSAAMHGCRVEFCAMGAADTAASDPQLAHYVAQVAAQVGGYTCHTSNGFGGSEDITWMMKRVQSRGGLATNIGIGSDPLGLGRSTREGRERILAAHTPFFDIDERAIGAAVRLLSATVLALCTDPVPITRRRSKRRATA